MKCTKAIALILAVISLLISVQPIAFAESQNDYSYEKITIIFHNDVTEYTKNKVISHFTQQNYSSISSKSLSCTLFGHDLETGTNSTITHKASSTAPRCLLETFKYEVCSNCDYTNYTLLSREYVYCCS